MSGLTGVRIERTPFNRMEPPERLTRFYCPACGKPVGDTYNLDESRKRCTKTWHLTAPELVEYVRVRNG